MYELERSIPAMRSTASYQVMRSTTAQSRQRL